MSKAYPPPTSDPFVVSCFQLDFEELDEPRNWRQMEDLANIPPLATGGRYQEALAIIEEGLAHYPDYHFLYTWRGFIQGKLGLREEERKTYLEGIRKSRSKISLCDNLGQWEFDNRHLAEAVRWWLRSCVIQLSQDKLEYAHPFLLLAYIAKDLGLPARRSALFKQCDQIDYVRLNAAGESQCSRLVSSQGEASIKRAIALLCEFYLGVSPEKLAEGQATPQPTAASTEPSPPPKPQQAQCDICSATVTVPDGYQLTTTQVVRSPRFWRDYYQRHREEFAAMGMPSYDALLRSPARTMVAEQIAHDATPWLVCEKCIHRFDVDREQARAYARQWWESGRTFSPPGTGPAPLSEVKMEEKPPVTPPPEAKEAPKAREPAPVPAPVEREVQPPRGVPRWSPVVALLNLTGLGLGYLYMHRWLRWLIHFLLTGGLIAAAFLTNASHFPLLWMVVFGLWLLWMVFDGWRQARRLVQATPEGTVSRPWLPIVLAVLIIGLEAAGFWGYRILGYREFVKGQTAYQLGDYQLTHQYLDRVVSLYALSFAPYVTLAEEYLADCEALQEHQQARFAAQAKDGMTRVPQPTHTPTPTRTPTSIPARTPTATPTFTLTPLPTAKATSATTPGPITEVATVRVAPDGSGDYPSLEAAVDAVSPGSTLVLESGTYRLARSLVIRRPLRLVGAGMDQTEVVSEAKGYVILFIGGGLFAAEDITFRHQGTAVAEVVVVEGGEIALARCRFTGAVSKEDQLMAGLLLRGSTAGVVQDCVADGNDGAGILVTERAQPVLEGNVCTDNHFGIYYWGNAGGTARQNECTENRYDGIALGVQAQPTLDGNVCTDNKYSGIYISEQAQPTLEGNVCTGNGHDGIAYFGDAGGVARQNECSGNESHGISVQEQAQPTLEGNVCTGNRYNGIVYLGDAGGVARQNECLGNGYHGIGVEEQARPTLERNICTDNEDTGIAYFGDAGGVARQNKCSGNGGYGIYVAKTADPDLVDNDCHDNIEGDIVDERQ